MYQHSSRLQPHTLAKATLFLCLLALLNTALIGCNQPSAAPKQNALQSWISQHAVSLKTVDPRQPLDDLLPLQQIVGNASIVGLGEATHGSHEFFTMKHRLLEFLVEKMGFTMFAMEATWSAGEQINKYVLTGQGDAANLMQQLYIWPWRTQEVLDLVQWMRTYNADSRHLQKVQFAGFDCQYIETITFDEVTQYLQHFDSQSAKKASSLYQAFRPSSTIDYNYYLSYYKSLPQSTKQQYVLNAQKVYDLLKGHQSEYERLSSPQTFAQMLQNARVIVQFTQLMSYNLSDPKSLAQGTQQRDASMAENSAWLHEHIAEGRKMVLWAHDAHIMSAKYGNNITSITSMGLFLRERYHSQYLAIGQSFYQGSFNANGLGDDTSLQTFTIQLPAADSYSYTLGSINNPLYLLDLRSSTSPSVRQWLDGPHGFLAVGASYSEKDQRNFYQQLSLRESFDVLIHIQKVTPSQIL